MHIAKKYIATYIKDKIPHLFKFVLQIQDCRASVLYLYLFSSTPRILILKAMGMIELEYWNKPQFVIYFIPYYTQ